MKNQLQKRHETNLFSFFQKKKRVDINVEVLVTVRNNEFNSK